MPTAPLLGPSDLVVVDVTGADRAGYLDDVLSQRVRDAPVGSAAGAMELGPHGEPTGIMTLAVLEDRVVLVVPPPALPMLERLQGRTFLADATFTRRDDLVVTRLRGETAAALAGAGLPTRPGTSAEVDGVVVMVHHHGADLVGDEDGTARVRTRLERAGVRAATAADVDAAEVAIGVPRMPEEVQRGRLPEELGLLPTHVHLAKGCYPGQEAVARMWMLGRPRRRLAVVLPPHDVTAGATLGEGRQRVEVTRVATHAGRRVALALVPADAGVGDEPQPGLVVERVVGDGMDVPGQDPTVTRRRDR